MFREAKNVSEADHDFVEFSAYLSRLTIKTSENDSQDINGDAQVLLPGEGLYRQTVVAISRFQNFGPATDVRKC